MKTMKLMMLFFVCVAMAACGGENRKYEPYKDKVLQSLADFFGTTKELLVKDLEIKFDSMSLSTFIVEDSINLITEQYNEAEAKNKERLEKTNAKIIENEEKAKTATGVSKFVYRSNRDDYKRDKQRIEAAQKKMKERYDKAMSTLENRDKKEVIYQLFYTKATILNPKTKIHEVSKDVSYFSPDGQTYILEVPKEVKNYVKKQKGL